MKVELRAKNIIVIGGATGIGYAAAQALLKQGAESIVLASRSEEKLQNAAASLKRNWRQTIEVVPFDITKIKSHEELIQQAKVLTGKDPDGLVISSGLNFSGKNWKGFDISEKDWDRVMDTNLKGVFFLMRNFANYIYENQMKGNICIVSSISAHRDMLSVYQVSKNAISGIVHAYGKHLCERGVVLNCVEPGTTDGGMLKSTAEYTDGIRPGKVWNDNSIRRVIRPEEIAEVICYLMSSGSEVLSGSCVLAGGGCKSISR